jgi:hypothetical protein
MSESITRRQFRRISWERWHLAGSLLFLVAIGCKSPPQTATTLESVTYVPHPSATWPWLAAEEGHPRNGVSHWLDKAADGTTLDLIRFDFKENSRLRFELYDQDEDDATPFDDRVDYYGKGVGAIVNHLHQLKRGKVVAAWNGMFFGYLTPGGGPGVVAHHIGPVVLRGKARYNVGRHRWTFGVSYRAGAPEFRAELLPAMANLGERFDFAADGAQLLVREGKPLPLANPVPSEDSAGTIAIVDDMRTSRVSMAWSKDNRFFYLLFVNEPDNELASKLEVKHGKQPFGGWALADLQRFWMALGAWGAVNGDGGAVAQLTYLRPDGKYEMLPPRIAAPNKRLTFEPDFVGAPAGGTLMTFYVVERK